MPVFTVGFGDNTIEIQLPCGTHCLEMSKPTPIAKPKDAVAEGIHNPIESPGLAGSSMARKSARELRVAIVISDNTRPVPYTGDSGILSPIIDELIELGVKPEFITIIVATGTHRGFQKMNLGHARSFCV